jgi:transketolase
MAQPLSMTSRLAGNPKGKPKFAVTLPNGVELSDPRAQRALIALMDMHAVIGGAASHFGGPAAFAEIASAVHGFVFAEAERRKGPWFDFFNLINDAGHCENGLYALKANYGVAGLNFESLKKFRSIESVLTGHGESHLFPEAVLLSNGPLGSAFPQSQGLAMADQLAGNPRTTITLISDGACMEGEARESLAALPGLAARGLMAPFVLIISDNNTKLSGRIDQESFDMVPTFKSLEILGWEVLTLEKGNDLQSCYESISHAISKAQGNPKKPVAIHAKTVKGIGTKKTSESSSGGHGFPCKSATELPAFIEEIYSGNPVPQEFLDWTQQLIAFEKTIEKVKSSVPEVKIQEGISKALITAAKAGLPIVSITSDLPGSTGVAAFRKEFPKLSFDIGVAESNMISVAAGFSKTGYIPVVDTFAQFGVTKGALPLIMASLSEAPMICIFSHTGFQDAADGASHQALSYLAMTQSIPHVRVVALTSSDEAEALLSQTLQEFKDLRAKNRTPLSTIFFLGRENFPKNFAEGISYRLDQPQALRSNLDQFQNSKSVALVAVGSMIPQAMEAQKTLEKQGIGSVVVNPSTLVPFDVTLLSPILKKVDQRVLVIEDHQKIGGFGEHFSRLSLEKGMGLKLRLLAVDGEFGRSAYASQDLYRLHKIDADAIVKAALEF